MTIKELFNQDKIVLGMLEEKSDESSYWGSAYFFINGVWNDSVEDLSTKQYTWAHKILEDMVEWRIKNKASADAYHDVRT